MTAPISLRGKRFARVSGSVRAGDGGRIMGASVGPDGRCYQQVRVSMWRGYQGFTRDDIKQGWWDQAVWVLCKDPVSWADEVAAAYQAARSARFEHGERG